MDDNEKEESTGIGAVVAVAIAVIAIGALLFLGVACSRQEEPETADTAAAKQAALRLEPVDSSLARQHGEIRSQPLRRIRRNGVPRLQPGVARYLLGFSPGTQNVRSHIAYQTAVFPVALRNRLFVSVFE